MGIIGVTHIILFGMIVFLQLANALQCYECSGSSSCQDPFDKNSGVSTTFCSKSCLKSKAERSGEHVILRGCGSRSDNTCDDSTILGVKVQTCQCNTNLCNGVRPVQGSLIALVASIFIYHVLF